jgi:hypothetical protein
VSAGCVPLAGPLVDRPLPGCARAPELGIRAIHGFGASVTDSPEMAAPMSTTACPTNALEPRLVAGDTAVHDHA